MAQSIISGHFFDAVTFDVEQKTAVSVRDGVLDYFGHELGLEPANKIFKVYRSPAQIATVAPLMAGIPLTNDHVDIGQPVPQSVGKVISAAVIDFTEGEASHLAIKNTLEVQSDFLATLTDKRELSLGYEARLIEDDKYDFRQVDIRPHHLAVVDAGRCGSGCRFLDRSPNNGDNTMTLDELIKVVEAMAAEVAELKKALAPAEDPAPEAGTDNATEEEEVKKEEEEAKKVKDSAALEARFQDAVTKATTEQVATTLAIIDRARQFLPTDYKFADKSGNQIMRDAIATQHAGVRFEDAELPVAFKMLRQPETKPFADFGRGNMGKFAELKDKEW
jgi:hypothetical protein